MADERGNYRDSYTMAFGAEVGVEKFLNGLAEPGITGAALVEIAWALFLREREGFVEQAFGADDFFGIQGFRSIA